ncbi:NAD(P)H-dependent oxidoreductase [Ruminococcus flavefaciens]|uniref:NAD(P)H-dependent oxidoreductase n=1 Tax=Ruminococcus flavefaciens TaxID=1265 RepID=UPI0026EDB9FE|nr:NAD(P)H-dependent oxidoreductase [Ruminococcus flavefaciens]
MVLFINACVRADQSRTLRLADLLLQQLNEPFTELNLSDIDFQPVDYSYIKTRDILLSEGNYDNPMFDLARQFAEADTIVIAAPYWDLSFPAMLKQYFEQINAIGITFKYTEEGYPIGLCKAKKLYYVTTAGGMFFPEEYGFGYIRALAENFYGIKDCIMFKAVGLDIDGADEEQILLECEKQIRESI